MYTYMNQISLNYLPSDSLSLGPILRYPKSHPLQIRASGLEDMVIMVSHPAGCYTRSDWADDPIASH